MSMRNINQKNKEIQIQQIKFNVVYNNRIYERATYPIKDCLGGETIWYMVESNGDTFHSIPDELEEKLESLLQDKLNKLKFIL